MSKDILQLGDFEHTMFIHLYEAYQELVNAVGAGENEYERLKKIDVMYTAWEKANLPSGEYASKKYIQNIQAKYAQLAAKSIRSTFGWAVSIESLCKKRFVRCCQTS